MTTMSRMGAAAALAAALLGGGCQIREPVSITATTTLEQAGFQRVDTAVTMPPGFVADAIYGCAPPRCAALSVVVVGSAQSPTLQESSLDILKAHPDLTRRALEASARLSFSGHSGRLSAFGYDPRSLTATMAGVLTAKDGERVPMRAVMRLRPGGMRFLMSMSKSPALAARYARADWLR